MTASEHVHPTPAPLRVALWVSAALYAASAAVWGWSSWSAQRGTAPAFAADLTGLALFAALLAVLRWRRQPAPRAVGVATLVLAVLAAFAAAQVAFDLARLR